MPDHKHTKQKFITLLDKEYERWTREQIDSKFAHLMADRLSKNALLNAWMEGRLGSFVAQRDPEVMARWYEDWVAGKISLKR